MSGLENREAKWRREKAYAFMGWPEHGGLSDPTHKLCPASSEG